MELYLIYLRLEEILMMGIEAVFCICWDIIDRLGSDVCGKFGSGDCGEAS